MISLERDANIYDKLSVLPGIQQAIGISTVLVNSVKKHNDMKIMRLYLNYTHDLKEKCYPGKTEVEAFNLLLNHFVNPHIAREQCKKLADKGTDTPLTGLKPHHRLSDDEKKLIISLIRSLYAQKDSERHSEKCTIGLLRLVPGIGTVYSGIIWYRSI